MSDKIQMTEEQARELWKSTLTNKCSYDVIEHWRKNGHIIKSELQQKVEEAKRMWDTKTYWTPLEHIQREAIELLEQSHPEFKK